MKIIGKGVKTYSTLTIKAQNHISDFVFIVKLGLISHLVLVYLLFFEHVIN